MFLLSADFFFKNQLFQNILSMPVYGTVRVSISLDPGQARRFVGPIWLGLDTNCIMLKTDDTTSTVVVPGGGGGGGYSDIFTIFVGSGRFGGFKRGTCIKGLFWPPLEPKTESCFSPISSHWNFRKISKV